MGAVTFSLDQKLVTCLKEQLHFSLFFETGTFKGETIEAMLPLFERHITVELSEDLFNEATAKFSLQKNVEVYQGNSPDVIGQFKGILKNLSVLYWLDAHWCVADSTSGENSQCPLLQEIEAIGHLNEQSAILIDDARLFLAPPLEPHEISHWPSFDSIDIALRKISSKHELMVVNDVIVFYPHLIRNAVVSYARKYGADWLQASKSYAENRELRSHLEDKQSELTNLYASAQETMTQLQEKEDSIKEKEAELESLYAFSRQAHTQLEEKENLIHIQAKAINDLNERIGIKEAELQMAYANALALQNQCQEKEAVVQELVSKLTHKSEIKSTIVEPNSNVHTPTGHEERRKNT